MKQNLRVALSGFALVIAVGAGAFGSHGLRGVVSPNLVEVWKTAVLYHLIHGLGLLLVAVLIELRPSSALQRAWLAMLLGMILFSGSLYLIVLTSARWLGPITPLGGVCMMIAWLLVAWAGLRSGRQQPEGPLGRH